MKIKLTLIEEMLGTKPSNKDIFADYVSSHAPNEDLRKQELETAEHREEAGTTVFHRLGGKSEAGPIIWDYQIKGFFKDACGALRDADDTRSKDLKAYRKKIDGIIFVAPRVIVLNMPADGVIGLCERPLRASTAMGDRVALARSETVPAGTELEFEITILNSGLEKTVREWLDYGKLRGIGQWRNSGKGRFTWQEVA